MALGAAPRSYALVQRPRSRGHVASPRTKACSRSRGQVMSPRRPPAATSKVVILITSYSCRAPALSGTCIRLRANGTVPHTDTQVQQREDFAVVSLAAPRIFVAATLPRLILVTICATKLSSFVRLFGRSAQLSCAKQMSSPLQRGGYWVAMCGSWRVRAAYASEIVPIRWFVFSPASALRVK